MYCSRCGTWVPVGEAACARCGMERAAEHPADVARARDAYAAVEQARPAAPAVHYGGFWRRFAAWCVDGLVLFFPNAILRVVVGLPTPLSFRVLDDDLAGRAFAVTAIVTALYWVYCAGLESSRWQGSLGQLLFGLRVTDLRGGRISFGRATGRFFAHALSMLLCMTGYLFNLWNPRRQTLHDMVAGCLVVRAERVPDAAPGHANVAGEA